MYFTDALRVLARRWVILLVGALVVIGAAFTVRALVPVQYQANGQILLVLPADATGKRTPTNPYLNLQPGLITTASIMANTVSGDDMRRTLDQRGFTADYTADLLPGTGPIIVISAEGATPKSALDMRDELVRQLNVTLRKLQGQVGVPDRQVITSLPTSLDSEAAPLRGDRLRALIAVAGALTVATLIVAFVVDASKRRRADGAAGGDRARTRRPVTGGPPRRPERTSSAATDDDRTPRRKAGPPAAAPEVEFAEEHPRPERPPRRGRKAMPRRTRRTSEDPEPSDQTQQGAGDAGELVPADARDQRS